MRAAPRSTSDGPYDQGGRYEALNYGRSLSARMMRKGHACLEELHRPSERFARVLEVGAGTGQHVRFVRHRFDEYVVSDASEAMLKVAAESSARDSRIRVEVQDARALSYADGSFDRLVACHVLEHLIDPVPVLQEWVRVLRPAGVLSLLLPCDPGLLWRLGRSLGPRRAATQAGLSYDYEMASEHVNSIFQLTTFLRYHFAERIERWYPCRVPWADANLFYIFEWRRPG